MPFTSEIHSKKKGCCTLMIIKDDKVLVYMWIQALTESVGYASQYKMDTRNFLHKAVFILSSFSKLSKGHI